MSRPMPLDDFRAVRIVLEPDDFALGPEEPDPPPTDLIPAGTWRAITGLSDDVAIRTSDHNGSALTQVYSLWSRWVTATGERPDALFDPMLDAGDDLQNSFFNALHGYYRAAFSSLRGVIEVMTIGTCGTFAKNNQLYDDWRTGEAELSFGTACDRLCSEPLLEGFNRKLRESGQSLFDAADRSRGLAGGHVRRWYRSLCNYAHSKPGFAEGDLWSSNGPVYVQEAFGQWHRAWLHAVSVCAVLILIVRPKADRQEIAALFSDRAEVGTQDLLRAFDLAGA